MGLWFRNPGNYIQECIATRTTDIVFDRGYTKKREIDPERYMHAWMPAYLDHWRVLHLGDQGTAAYNIDGLYAVYPTWQYGVDPLELLIWMLEHPAGDDPELYTLEDSRPDETPFAGQEHIVVLTDLPAVGTHKDFYAMLWKIQGSFPESTMMIHGLYGVATILNAGWEMWDIEPRHLAGFGKVWLPTGREVPWRDADEGLIRIVGYRKPDLEDPKTRCRFNIDSYKYSASHWNDDGFRPSMARDEEVDIDTPERSWKPKIVKKIPSRVQEVTDMIACDICSLASSCYVYRPGSVCTLPRSSGSELAKYFKTRDSGMIVQGLMELIEVQSDRLEKGLQWEDEGEELSPEVSKLVNSLFRQGVDLAKLVDPKLAKGPLVAIQTNVQGAHIVTASNNQQMIAQAKAELEEAGFRPDELTFEIVDEYMKTGILPQRSLPKPENIVETEVIEVDE